MMKKKLKWTAAAAVALTLCAMNTYSFDASVANATPFEGATRGLAFYNAQAQSVVETVQNNKQDQSFDQLRQALANNRVTIQTHGLQTAADRSPKGLSDKINDLAYPIDAVRNDATLQADLHQALVDGKKVYLYGEGFSIREYEQLLGIEGEIAPTQSIEELKNTTRKEPKLLMDTEQLQNVIGFSLVNGPNKVYLSNFVGGKAGHTPETLYLHAILDDQIDTAEQTDAQNGKTAPTNVSFLGKDLPIKQNVAHADASPVTSKSDINTYVSNNSGTTVGKINTDYYLSREKDESDSTYDYFVVEDHTEITGYNGADPYYLKTDHDIPYDSDHIKDWSPSDTSGDSISVSVPWGISYSFDPNGSIAVNDIGNQDLDYGRWEVTPRWYASVLPDPTRFKPATAWLSSGTYAVMDIRNDAYFDQYGSAWLAHQQVHVAYDY
ncbi:MAG TPA: hypothetical protein VFV52_11960 [Bacilli bacterium]|nr:hypothetical protein [Bacilli bacterium]